MTDEGRQHEASVCDAALVQAFQLLGKRWNGLILSVLSPGAMKFSEVRRAVGSITDSMLADRLVDLVEAGVVARVVTGEPPRIAYSLTPKGAALQPILDQLAGWAAGNLPDGGVEPRLEGLAGTRSTASA